MEAKNIIFLLLLCNALFYPTRADEVVDADPAEVQEMVEQEVQPVPEELITIQNQVPQHFPGYEFEVERRLVSDDIKHYRLSEHYVPVWTCKFFNPQTPQEKRRKHKIHFLEGTPVTVMLDIINRFLALCVKYDRGEGGDVQVPIVKEDDRHTSSASFKYRHIISVAVRIKEIETELPTMLARINYGDRASCGTPELVDFVETAFKLL